MMADDKFVVGRVFPANVSEHVRALNPHLFAAQRDTPEAPAQITERTLQDQCERYLEQIGYVRLTAANALDAKAPRGWFGHLAQAKGNPFMPDLLIFSRGRALLVELKVREDYRPGQRAMIDRGEWEKATTLDELKALVAAFEEITPQFTHASDATIMSSCLQIAAPKTTKEKGKMR